MTDIDRAIEEAKAEQLPFESWERLPGESGAAFAAFKAYRDMGLVRNIRKAVEGVEKDEYVRCKKYRMWRNWCSQFKWRERAADFDRYIERLNQAELRKTIEAKGEMRRDAMGVLLNAVKEKVGKMNPQDIPIGVVNDWMNTAIRGEREDWEMVLGKDGKGEQKQGDLFPSEFQGS